MIFQRICSVRDELHISIQGPHCISQTDILEELIEDFVGDGVWRWVFCCFLSCFWFVFFVLFSDVEYAHSLRWQGLF